ncbi:MAG: putative exodeoxyribonuclease 8 [Prokaryotic dsDNA virus sp.]|nr:MAG: putative exodeoxyribonuclease 8 [Prokaryotic dsDNA virus sp.]|tara:strand:- start:19843 stop:20832 length:990 start_codon:yes stop_codon:yes gene_type:complete
MITITALEDGQTVQNDGAYQCTLEHYHTQAICPGPSVSSTGLRKLSLQSPHAFWKTFEGNPNRYPPKEDNGSLVLGKAAHALMLGDEVFNEKFVYVPKDAPQRPTKTQIAAFERDGVWSESAKDRAAFWEKYDKKAQGKLFLKAEDMLKIQYMAENLAANPLAVEVLKSDLIEISMIWQDPITGIWLKSRPDCIPSNGFDFGDLKTFAPKSRDLIIAAQRSITDFGYPMQMALAVMGAEATLGTTAETCALVFVQSSEPFEVIPVEVDTESLYWAKVLLREGIDRMARGIETGDWPGVSPEIVKYTYPPSMLHRFGEMQVNGQLPSMER